MNQDVGPGGSNTGPLGPSFRDLMAPPSAPPADCTARISVQTGAAPPDGGATMDTAALTERIRAADSSAYPDISQALKQKQHLAPQASAPPGALGGGPFDAGSLAQATQGGGGALGGDVHSRRGSYDGFQNLSAQFGGNGTAAALSGLLNTGALEAPPQQGGMDFAHFAPRPPANKPPQPKQCAPGPPRCAASAPVRAGASAERCAPVAAGGVTRAAAA